MGIELSNNEKIPETPPMTGRSINTHRSGLNEEEKKIRDEYERYVYPVRKPGQAKNEKTEQGTYHGEFKKAGPGKINREGYGMMFYWDLDP